MTSSSDRQPLHPQSAIRWAVFLSAVAAIGFLCAAILFPFLDVIAWSSVIAIAFYSVHRRLLGKARRPTPEGARADA